MQFIKSFTQVNKDSVNIAGGKGASLGEMTQAGIAVPPGFIILASAFDEFLKTTDINIAINSILKTVDSNVIHTIDNASKQISSLILGIVIPDNIVAEIILAFKKLDTEFVAVRSSATAEDSKKAAWAGQLDTFLNTTEETILENIKKCWASLFSPRAIFYRFEQNLQSHEISVGVVVQKMVNSEISGIAFSVHPVTQDKNQLIIEAGLGLGESIVSGQITPDSYVVSKDSLEIIDININEQNKALFRGKNGKNEWQTLDSKRAKQQVLTKENILELSKQIIIIEKHYGFPVDVEWAYEANNFYIVQSRPITTLK